MMYNLPFSIYDLTTLINIHMMYVKISEINSGSSYFIII